MVRSTPARDAGYHDVERWRERAAAQQVASKAGTALHVLLIRRAEPGLVISGDINLTNIVRGAFQAGYLGYGLDYAVVGQGYMTNALTALIPYLFEEPPV